MARSQLVNPMTKLARAVGRDVNARTRLARGANGTTTPDAPATALTALDGDGSELTPYITRHALMWGYDAFDDAAVYWMDVPPEVI